MLDKAIRDAFRMKKERGWDTLYFAVDLHGTIIEPGRGRAVVTYEKAWKVLQYLSNQKDITLILYTSTSKESLKEFWNWCEVNKIVFKYHNENPECMNTTQGDYSKKFYFNVMLDDRAGFDPETDWDLVEKTVRDETR